ncbi:SMI1/KNR4 family protein [Mycolicibacterium boenickei]
MTIDLGSTSVGLRVDGREAVPGNAMLGLIGEIGNRLPPASAGKRRHLTVELSADGTATARTFEFSGGDSFSGSGEAEAVIFDDSFRLPGHEHPARPQGAHEVSGAPTDPGVLARMTALVGEFRKLYLGITGTDPGLPAGVGEQAIRDAERVLGLRLPEDLRALYRVVAYEPDEIGLLGRFGHMPLERLVEARRDQWATPWVSTASDPVDGYPVPEPWPPGFIKPNPSSQWRIAFGGDGGGDYVAVDLDPGQYGVSGQVIRFGRGTLEPQYVCGSVLAMLEEVVSALREGRHAPGLAWGDDDSGFDCLIYTYFDCFRQDEPAHHLFDLSTQTLESAVAAAKGGPGEEYDDLPADDGEPISLGWNTIQPNDPESTSTTAEYLPLVQELTIRDAVSPLSLGALGELCCLRTLTLINTGDVEADLPHPVPVQQLEIEARRIDLKRLAGHPSVWSIKLSGMSDPVDVAVLTALPNLRRLDLSGAQIDDVGELAKLTGVRVLVLRDEQWVLLRTAGIQLPNLAAAKNIGARDFVGWVNWLAPGSIHVTTVNGTG